MFFVISGYLISSILFCELREGRFSLVDFYARRIRRIFPTLLLVLIACLLFGWISLLAIEYVQLSRYTVGGVAFVSNFVLSNELGYFDRSADLKPLLHLWSLAIEEQFYIVWPPLLWLCRRMGIKFVVVGTGLLCISLFASAIGNSTNPATAFYSPIARGWEILAGALLALAPLEQMRLRNVASVAGFIFIIGGGFAIKDTSSFVIANLLPVLGAVLLISAGARAYVNRTLLSHPAIVWVGLISYPLYLWHWPLLSFARITGGEPPSSLVRALLVLVSFVLAWATYRFVELPIRMGGGLRRKAGVLSLCAVVVALAASGIGFANGFPARPFNVVNAGIGNALNYDWHRNFREGTCFLNGDSFDRAIFAKECSPAATSTRPLVVLWGDSHAASLYQGLLRSSARYHFVLAQFTASGCPPILNFAVRNRPRCMRLNGDILQTIARLKPDVVLMAAYWSKYDGTAGVADAYPWEQLEPKKLASTVRTLQSLDIKNITLVGHLPTFDIEQPELLRRVVLSDHVDDRSYRDFSAPARTYDEKIRVVAAATGIHFIDPLGVLCDETGCLISLSRRRPIPLAFDYGHLDTDGSDYFVGELFRRNAIAL